MSPQKMLLPALFCTLPAAAQVTAEPLPPPPAVVYRQVLPNGGIVYSDKRVAGARVEQALDVEQTPPGSTWSVDGNPRPPAARLARSTPVQQVATIPHTGRARTLDEAAAEVARAEMLLEDARRQRDAGHAPRLDELGNTGPASAYAERQRALTREVARAEAGLRQAKAEWAAARYR